MPNEIPTIIDWEDHLSTIFTEIRLKRFIEFVYSNEYLAKVAFQDLIKKRYPMTPEQIKALQKIYRTKLTK